MVESQQKDIDTVLSLVAHYARRFLHNPHDAEDLAQEVLIKAWRAYTRNPAISECDDAQIAAWLLLITKRTAIDMVRAAKRREPFNHELTDCHIATNDVESHVEACEIIDTALSHLQEKDRTVITLAAQGYTYKEIGAKEQRSVSGVKSRLRRARRAVRDVAA